MIQMSNYNIAQHYVNAVGMSDTNTAQEEGLAAIAAALLAVADALTAPRDALTARLLDTCRVADKALNGKDTGLTLIELRAMVADAIRRAEDR